MVIHRRISASVVYVICVGVQAVEDVYTCQHVRIHPHIYMYIYIYIYIHAYGLYAHV